MLDRLRKYTIDKNSTVLMTLKIIDDNKKCFAIVIDEAELVLAVLTDGDIRRALLNGKTLDDKVETIIKSGFMYLNINDSKLIINEIWLISNTVPLPISLVVLLLYIIVLHKSFLLARKSKKVTVVTLNLTHFRVIFCL